MKRLGSKVSDCIKEKKKSHLVKIPLRKTPCWRRTYNLKRLTQPIFPPLLVLTTISSASHHSEAILHNFYFSLDIKVTHYTRSCMYWMYERHWGNTSCRTADSYAQIVCIQHSLTRAGNLSCIKCLSDHTIKSMTFINVDEIQTMNHKHYSCVIEDEMS